MKRWMTSKLTDTSNAKQIYVNLCECHTVAYSNVGED